uniref:Uncharacterized protein n=1 Tax=Aplanochytrium stocchinoi TaxID=215587 RepID=A0A7S3PP07_9STRA
MTDDGEGPVKFESFLQWYCAGLETGEYGGGKISSELKRKKNIKELNGKRDKVLNSMKKAAKYSSLKALNASTLLKNSFKSVGKSSLYRDLVLDGWENEDVVKALDRCVKNTTKEEVEEWLGKNSSSPKKVYNTGETKSKDIQGDQIANFKKKKKRLRRRDDDAKRKENLANSLKYLDKL